MRRYWLISLAVGAGAALATLALFLGGVFDGVSERLWTLGVSRGWSPPGPSAHLRWLEVMAVALPPLGVAWGAIEATRDWQRLLLVALAVAWLALLGPTLALYGIRFDPAAPVLAALLAGGGAWGFSRTASGRRKGVLEEALGTRVSARTFHRLLEGSEPLPLEGDQREVTTLVCRLLLPAGPEEAANAGDRLRMGSLFLRGVSSHLLSRGAYLDYSGPDCVRAFFGLVGDPEEAASRACEAALELRSRLKALAQECDSRWFLTLRAGVGISSGTMTVGLCGGPDQRFLAGMGGDAGLADRLALANARLGSDLLLGPDTYRLVSHQYEVRPLELLYDPVQQNLSEVYQLISTRDALDPEARERRDAFWRGVVQFRAGRNEVALEQFSRARVPGLEDEALERLVSLVQEGLVQPEPRSRRLVRELTEEGRARLQQQL